MPSTSILSLAFLDDGPDARRRQHASKAAAAGPNALDERALRHQVDRHFVGHHLLLYVRIEPDVARRKRRDQRRVE